MTKAVYDTGNSGVVDNSKRLGGNLPDHYAKAFDAVAVYTHTKSGTTHILTGIGDNMKFIATNGFSDGDNFLVNGTVCTAATIDGEPLSDGCFVSGAVVGCFKNGATINFKPGGAGLGIKVVAAADKNSLPIAAGDATVAVVTAEAITGWCFSATGPEIPAQGMVWFRIGSSSAVPLNVIKRNTAMVYGQSCAQYIQGTWTARTAFVRKGSVWMSWEEYLFDRGTVSQYTWTPGFYIDSNSYIGNVMHVFKERHGYYTSVDLTGITAVVANCNAFNRGAGANTKGRLFVNSVAPSGSSDMGWNATFNAVTEFTSTGTVRINTGAFSGRYFVGLSCTCTVSSTSDYFETDLIKLERG